MRSRIASLFVMALLAVSAVTSAQAKDSPWLIDEAAITGSHEHSIYKPDFIQYDFDSKMVLTPTSFREEGTFFVTHYCREATGKGQQTECIDLTGKPYLVWGTWLIEGGSAGGELSIASGSIDFYVDLTGNNRPYPLQSEEIGSTMTVDLNSRATVGSSAAFPKSKGSYAATYRDFQLTEFGAEYWRGSKQFPTSLGFEGVTWNAVATGEPGTYLTTGSGTAFFLER